MLCIWRLRVVHQDSWVLPVAINGVRSNGLVDTGAFSVDPFFNPWTLKTANVQNGPYRIQGVSNKILSTVGDIHAGIQIGAINVVVSVEHESFGSI